MPGVAIVIPTLNEVEAIGRVIDELPKSIVREIIVADSGSTDGTLDAARAAGARVLTITERGYGRACFVAATMANEDCDIIVFMDGDGADRGDLLERLVAPIRNGEQDLSLPRVRDTCANHIDGASQFVAGHVCGLRHRCADRRALYRHVRRFGRYGEMRLTGWG